MPELRRKPHTRLTDGSSKSSRYSDESCESQSTAPTSIHESPRPSLRHAATAAPTYHRASYEPDDRVSPSTGFYARSSVETYASTLASDLDLYDEPDTVDEYEVTPNLDVEDEADTRPSDPQEFARLFPSMRRMVVRHDGTTTDRNMNLRIETPVSEDGHKAYVQLFHLRMQDLKKREFSLRRYCRNSGREVCHSIRRYKTPSEGHKSSLQNSVSHALANIVSKPDFKRQNSTMSTTSKKSVKSYASKRQDSGYGSGHDEDDEGADEDFASFLEKAKQQTNIQLPTNTTKLEFSNYAQVQVKRRGAKASKRYEFEYWGTKYTWKRVVEKNSPVRPISFHLVRGESGQAVAHIVPEPLSRYEAQVEAEVGGWVPPCSMWISDSSIIERQADVAEVIVSTGLIALVDDCIKRRWHRLEKHVHEIRVPLTPLRLEMEYVGPKAFVEQMFRRRNSGGQTKWEDRHRQSPLRHESAVEGY